MILTKRFVFRFSDFEVQEHELRITRGGRPLNLEPKAFRVLVYLVEHAGQLVTKSELIDAVWGGVAVTENSLTRVIALLRRALEDDPRQPRFIETVSTAGYRFICPVKSESIADLSDSEPDRIVEGTPAPGAVMSGFTLRSWLHRWRWVLSAGMVVGALSAVAYLWDAGRPSPPHISEIAPITNDPRHSFKLVSGTDGSRIYLNLFPAEPGQVSVSGGEITSFPIDIPATKPVLGYDLGPLSPDGSSFLVFGQWNEKDLLNDIWIAGISGRPVRLLTRASDAGWSADGGQVIYTTPKREIFTIPSTGGEPHLVRTMEGPLEPYGFTYSPDGTRIRFNWGPKRLMEMSPNGANLHEVLPDWHQTDFKCCSFWAPDGSSFFFFSAASAERGGRPAYQMWVVDERRGWMHKHTAEPVQLTFGPMTWFGGVLGLGRPGGTFTHNGRKILADGEILRGELLRYNRHTGRLEPFLDGVSADMVDFTRDGKFLLYVPFPGDTLLRTSRDGTGAQQVLNGFNHPGNPRWSPDSTQIAFIRNDPNGQDSTYIVSSQGGTPTRVLPDNKCCNEADPTWSPDGKQLAMWVQSPEGKIETELRIVNPSTHQVSYLPRPPKQAWSPRWSPDGRYIVCLTNLWPNTDGLEIYDFETNHWKIILSQFGSGNWPSWSRDSRWIYYVVENAHQPSIFRISVDGGRPERIVDLPGFRSTGWEFSWFGLDPDDNPLMLRDAGTNEIYALTLERK